MNRPFAGTDRVESVPGSETIVSEPKPPSRAAAEKVSAGLRGLKHALRLDSSFFAHAHRAIVIVLVGGVLGVGPMGWCLLAIGFALALIGELCRAALERLADALPDGPEVRQGRDIAAAVSLAATGAAGVLAVTVLLIKFGDLQGWWK